MQGESRTSPENAGSRSAGGGIGKDRECKPVVGIPPLLWEPLPEAAEIDDVRYPLHTDFRTWIRFELLARDETIPDAEKLAGLLSLAFSGESLPPTLSGAARAVRWFYSGGSEERVKPQARGEGREAAYCFSYDQKELYAAFYSEYGLDLAAAEMHWWRFRALLSALPASSAFGRAVGYRTVSLSEIRDRAQREFYRKMKKKYALPRAAAEREALSELEQALLSGGDLSALL